MKSNNKTLRRILEIVIPVLLIAVAVFALSKNGTTENTATAPAAGSITVDNTADDTTAAAAAASEKPARLHCL